VERGEERGSRGEKESECVCSNECLLTEPTESYSWNPQASEGFGNVYSFKLFPHFMNREAKNYWT